MGDEALTRSVRAVAESTGFSGVVRVDEGDALRCQAAYGFAHRGHRIANTPDTRFAIASGTKGLTAVALMCLVEDGVIELGARARPILGDDLPLIDDAVTVEHLLAHRSGIGDYVDEEATESETDYVLSVPVHRLAGTDDYLPALDGHAQVAPPGAGFAYNNSGYVVLALIAERLSGMPFARLLHERVVAPAGMRDTAFLRSDEPAGRVALGYLEREGLRTNLLHLPVRGSGDGGLYSTAADVRAFWTALLAGRLVSRAAVEQLLRPRSEVPSEATRYGLGFWVPPGTGVAALVGADAGVSFSTVHDARSGLTATVLANTTAGAWPVAEALAATLRD